MWCWLDPLGLTSRVGRAIEQWRDRKLIVSPGEEDPRFSHCMEEMLCTKTVGRRLVRQPPARSKLLLGLRPFSPCASALGRKDERRVGVSEDVVRSPTASNPPRRDRPRPPHCSCAARCWEASRASPRPAAWTKFLFLQVGSACGTGSLWPPTAGLGQECQRAHGSAHKPRGWSNVAVSQCAA